MAIVARFESLAVDDQLHGRVAPGVDQFGEIVRHDQPHHHIARVDRADQIAVIVEVHPQRKVPRGAEFADELPAARRVALIPNGQGDVVYVQGQREAEQRQQQYGRGHGHQQAARVAEDVQELLAGDGRHATKVHRFTSCSGRSSRSWASIRSTNTSSSDGSDPSGRASSDFSSCGVPRAINPPR